MNNNILTPFVQYQKEDKIKKIKSFGFVNDVEDRGSFLLVSIKSEDNTIKSPLFRYSPTEFKCHELHSFTQELMKKDSFFLDELFYIGPSFVHTFATLPKEIKYSIDNEEYMLPLDKVVQIASIRSRDLVKSIHSVIGLDREYFGETERTSSLIEFLQTMTMHHFYSQHPDFNKVKTLKKLYKRYDEKFVKFWMKENSISEQQLLCDHNDSDQFSTDGYWYNSVGECCKCLINTDRKDFESSSCENAYKYWKAALKNYKVKKEKV